MKAYERGALLHFVVRNRYRLPTPSSPLGICIGKYVSHDSVGYSDLGEKIPSSIQPKMAFLLILYMLEI